MYYLHKNMCLYMHVISLERDKRLVKATAYWEENKEMKGRRKHNFLYTHNFYSLKCLLLCEHVTY